MQWESLPSWRRREEIRSMHAPPEGTQTAYHIFIEESNKFTRNDLESEDYSRLTPHPTHMETTHAQDSNSHRGHYTF
jgi:hypothetical protein